MANGTCRHIIFLGIGGIGMSALARYYQAQGATIIGYDRTRTTLTDELEHEGMAIVYDYEGLRAQSLCNHSELLVVRTAAIHDEDPVYRYFVERGIPVIKRAELLGKVTQAKKALCVAGTHGKTTTTTMLAHIFHRSHLGGSAFLGGISNNYHSNLLIDNSDYVAVEADEYDRSFLHLKPYMSVITSIDPDHLDIYGDAAGFRKGFDDYASLVEKAIVIKEGYEECLSRKAKIEGHKCPIYTYAVESETADFTAANTLKHIHLQVPTRTNIEDAVAAAAIAKLNGVTDEEIKAGLESFQGVARRFDIVLRQKTIALQNQRPLCAKTTDEGEVVLIDDYAHHPTELQGSIDNVHDLFPNHQLVAVFQPHLYSRTRDFMEGFAQVLSEADKLILLPIYPAREEPIAGVTSEVLCEKCRELNPACHARVVEKKDLNLATILSCGEEGAAYNDEEEEHKNVVILMVGAGDISELVEPVRLALTAQ